MYRVCMCVCGGRGVLTVNVYPTSVMAMAGTAEAGARRRGVLALWRGEGAPQQGDLALAKGADDVLADLFGGVLES